MQKTIHPTLAQIYKNTLLRRQTVVAYRRIVVPTRLR